ncbi:hypothetical protein SAMN04487969_11268 [Paenibacillus algorifonticola]|uniref:Uncharacterized protein n=1 Tax=Paenibacillus algorifonticola TaxID=684063 RepID=A0A1I2FIX4_9BACL|nr:hypothetical protein SAMN04487969_11268 [Paenibacillus algorifonticola]
MNKRPYRTNGKLSLNNKGEEKQPVEMIGCFALKQRVIYGQFAERIVSSGGKKIN